jgi:prepilin-type processing-associated H-X9-DG protein
VQRVLSGSLQRPQGETGSQEINSPDIHEVEEKGSKEEVTEAIQTVIARYGYAPEFLGLEKQVGAVVPANSNILFADGRVKRRPRSAWHLFTFRTG